MFEKRLFVFQVASQSTSYDEAEQSFKSERMKKKKEILLLPKENTLFYLFESNKNQALVSKTLLAKKKKILRKP